jgi:hypothetical protein
VCHRCHTYDTLIHPVALQEGTSRPSWSPAAGGRRRGRRHAGSPRAQRPCSRLSLHQAPSETPARPPRETAGSVPQRGVYHDTVRSPLPEHPPSGRSPLLYHMYPRFPILADLPCSRCPFPGWIPLSVFFPPGAAHWLRAPYISLWTAAALRRPGPPRVAPPIPSPDSLSYQRAESKGTASLRAPGMISEHGPGSSRTGAHLRDRPSSLGDGCSLSSWVGAHR